MTHYPGKELELFDKANFWRNYLYLLIRKYIGKNILEVGAGIGSFTNIYLSKNKNIVLSEIDNMNYKEIKKKFSNKMNVKITNNFTKDLKGVFDTILYLSVLEHIKKDKQEINFALQKLKKKGHLVICVPAHNSMYSNFDKEIGHFKRYEINFFNFLNIKNATLEKVYYIDSCGYLLYLFNKIFFKKEVYPTRFKVFVWDKIFIPITYVIDFFSLYKVGKNIVCIIKKK